MASRKRRIKSMNRSTLAFWFFKLVSIVQRIWFFHVHSRWSANPVNVVVRRQR